MREMILIPNEEFEAIKKAAIAVWSNYDDTYGYATGKINIVNSIENHGDNYEYIISMFDYLNQEKLIEILEEPTKTFVANLTKDSREAVINLGFL